MGAWVSLDLLLPATDEAIYDNPKCQRLDSSSGCRFCADQNQLQHFGRNPCLHQDPPRGLYSKNVKVTRKGGLLTHKLHWRVLRVELPGAAWVSKFQQAGTNGLSLETSPRPLCADSHAGLFFLADMALPFFCAFVFCFLSFFLSLCSFWARLLS